MTLEDGTLMNGQVPLSSLESGERGIIVKLNLTGSVRQRFMAMGLVKGENVTLERVAPLGDPLELLVKGYHLSVRKSEASQIIVTRSNNHEN
jgi:Fe2+ transport system protein FeoA